MRRDELIRVDEKKVRLCLYRNSDESKDKIFVNNHLSFSRKRVYNSFQLFFDNKMGSHAKRLLRGLPIDIGAFETTVFQLSCCNISCWYCYVDDDLMKAQNLHFSEWVSVAEMIDALEMNDNDFRIIDLSGGQPDLAPEWCLWVMEEIEKRGLKGKVFIWMDDNLLSTDKLFGRLGAREVSFIAGFPLHSRVGCFKGFDEASFRFNTGTDIYTLDDQIKGFRKLYNAGFELYSYVILTPEPGNFKYRVVEDFIMRLMDIHPLLPLRVIPIEIKKFHATRKRMSYKHEQSIKEQFAVYELWDDIMEKLYGDLRDIPYEEIKI